MLGTQLRGIYYLMSLLFSFGITAINMTLLALP